MTGDPIQVADDIWIVEGETVSFYGFAYPTRYTTDPEGVIALQAAQAARNQQAFELLEQELQDKPFLLGENLSVADVYMAMIYNWHRVRPNLPRCTALTHAIAGHPVIAPIWQRNFGARQKTDWGNPSSD